MRISDWSSDVCSSDLLNLGSLRSAMSLTLHTHHASRIWHGRAPAEGKPAIVGLNGFVSIMNKLKRGAEQDDPYSDWWMLRIEDKLEQTKNTLQTLGEQVDQALTNVPSARSEDRREGNGCVSQCRHRWWPEH